jgi:hypothetical protein
MILRQSDASRCPGLQTPHADARRPPRERFSPSAGSGHCGSRPWTSQLGGARAFRESDSTFFGDWNIPLGVVVFVTTLGREAAGNLIGVAARV